MKKNRYNYKQFFLNIRNQIILFIPLNIMLLSLNHDVLYAFKNGFLAGIAVAVILSMFILYSYPIHERLVNNQILKNRINDRQWNQLTKDGFLSLEQLSLIGDIEIEYGERSKIIGSKYSITKFLSV